MSERVFYHDIFGRRTPDDESMAAYLIDEGVLFLGECVSKDGCYGTQLLIFCNDHFSPAADAEPIMCSEIPTLFEAYINNSIDGVLKFIADKRGYKDAGHWTESGIR